MREISINLQPACDFKVDAMGHHSLEIKLNSGLPETTVRCLTGAALTLQADLKTGGREKNSDVTIICRGCNQRPEGFVKTVKGAVR
jgi:hypothetical protein